LVAFRGMTYCTILGPGKLTCLCFTALLCISVCTRGVAQEDRSPAVAQTNSAVAQARSALSSGNPTTAIDILSSHLHAHPKDTSARLLLADVYLITKQNDQAEEQYQAVLQLAPDNYLALTGLGESYERAGNLEKAEPMMARAAKLSHGSPKIQTAWAALLARLHRYSEASRVMGGLLPPASRGERLSFYRLKASIASGLGDTVTAASEMEKALALSPNQTGLQIAAAAAEIQAKHWNQAATLAGPLFDRTHDPGLGLMLLEAQLGGGDDTKATLESLRAVTLPPQQELPLRQRTAELLIAHGRFTESTDELKRAVELNPVRADLNFNLALAQFKAGRLDDALATAQKCQKLADSAELEDLIGDIQEARGDNLAAVRSYQAAVALAPSEEKFRLSLALDLIRHKSFEPASVVLKQAQGLHPESWRVKAALGMVEYFAGSAEDATKMLLEAAQIAPQAEPVLRYLGDIQMDISGAPDPAALTRLCEYGDTHSNAGTVQFYCAALLFRRDYVSHDRSHTDEVLRRLNAAAKALPDQASPHCQLGKAYRWVERWQEALGESETCARMDPNLAEAHYHLAQIYQHFGQQQQSEQEMKLYQAASARLADENARRDQTINAFLYSIQQEKR